MDYDFLPRSCRVRGANVSDARVLANEDREALDGARGETLHLVPPSTWPK